MSPRSGVRYCGETTLRVLVRSLRGRLQTTNPIQGPSSPARDVCDSGSWTVLEPEEHRTYAIPSYWPRWARHHYWLPLTGDSSLFEVSHGAAWVCSFNDSVCLPDGRVVVLDTSGSIRAWVVDEYNGMGVSYAEHQESKAIVETARTERACVVPIGTHSSDNYYHWTFQSLPRIGLALRYLGSEHCLFHVGRLPPPKFVVESLAVLGVCADRIISGDPVRARSVFTHTPSMQPPWWVLRFLQETADRIGGPVATGTGKIYYHRGGGRRRIINQEQVIDLFERHGFTVVYPGEMSYVEQVRTAQNANCMAGVHGACFASVVYARPKATIIEFIPNNYPEPYFMLLSADLGLTHHALFGAEPRVRDIIGGRAYFDMEADVTVDHTMLSRVLNSF
jgi:hypothetical protein